MKKLNNTVFLVSFVITASSTKGISQENVWVPTNGPSGGRVTALAINNSGHIFAGTFLTGLLRSMDNGNSWMSRFLCAIQEDDSVEVSSTIFT